MTPALLNPHHTSYLKAGPRPDPRPRPHRIPRPSPLENRLLAALPSAEFDLLVPHLEPVSLGVGDMLHEPHQQMHYAIFPTSAVVSLRLVTVDGATAEIAGVGSEGVVGIALFLGGDTLPSSAVVQMAGNAWRLERHLFEAAFERSAAMQSLLLRYVQARIVQVAQTVACNRHHSVDQQFCRYLLQALDRAPGRDLVMTQEMVAQALGVRRESVTEAVGKLQQSGSIRHRRGHIIVVDRHGLESRVCECYGVVKEERDRLLSNVHYLKDRDIATH